MPEDQAPGREMPKYRSHKIVHALRIKDLAITDSGVMLQPEEAGYAPILPLEDWQKRTRTMLETKNMDLRDLIGGYYVVYDGGFTSWSPKEAFEDGYTPID